MSEDKEEFNRTEAAKFFSDISRNSGKVSFRILYTGTEGNVAIDKEFQEFCFEHSNNEYLQGIKILLESFNHYKQLMAIQEYLEAIDDRLNALEESKEVPKVSEKKTF